MSKSKYLLEESLSQMMIGTYGHYIDKGLSVRASTMRVSRESYLAIHRFMNSSQVDSKDLVILEHTMAYRDFITARAKELQNKIKETEESELSKELVDEYHLVSEAYDITKRLQEFYFKSNEIYEKNKRLKRK